jgi:hypothetical protein
MARTDYRTLIDRGRKAGLGTSELYSALAARRPELGDPQGQADTNGFVSDISRSGRPLYHPLWRRPNG